MTLIAAIYDGKGTITLSDLVLTNRLKGPGIANSVPGAKGEQPLSAPNVVTLRRKTFRIAPGISFLWSGTRSAATTATAIINTLVHLGQPPSEALLERAYAEGGIDEADLSCMLIGLGFDGTPSVYHRGCFEMDLAGLGHVWLAGSGAGDFLAEFARLETDWPAFFDPDSEHYNLFLKASHVDCSASAMALGSKARSLSNFWGGGAEVFFARSGAFVPSDTHIHAYSVLYEDLAIEPLTYMQIKRYVGNELIMLDFHNQAKRMELHAVPNLFLSNEDRVLPDVRMVLPHNDYFRTVFLTVFRVPERYIMRIMPKSDFLKEVDFNFQPPFGLAISAEFEKRLTGLIYDGFPDLARRPALG